MKRIGLNVPAQLAGKGYRVSAVHVPLGHVAEARTPIISFKSDIAGNGTKTVQLQDRVRVIRVICGIDDPLDGFNDHLMILEIVPDDMAVEVSSNPGTAPQSTAPAAPPPGAAAAAPPRAEAPKRATVTTTAEPRKHEPPPAPQRQSAPQGTAGGRSPAKATAKTGAKRARQERDSRGFQWFVAIVGMAGAAASYYFTGALVWAAVICFAGLLFMGWGLRFMYAGAVAGMMYFLLSLGPDGRAPDIKRAEPQIVDELISRILSPSVSEREKQEFERWLRS
jgi:hypothetical protein